MMSSRFKPDEKSEASLHNERRNIARIVNLVPLCLTNYLNLLQQIRVSKFHMYYLQEFGTGVSCKPILTIRLT